MKDGGRSPCVYRGQRSALLLTPLYGFWGSNSGPQACTATYTSLWVGRGRAVKLRLQACTASTFTCLAISPVSTVLSSPVGGGGDLLSYSLFPLSLAPNVSTHTIWSHSLNWLCEYSMPRIGSKFSLLLNWSSAFRCLVY